MARSQPSLPGEWTHTWYSHDGERLTIRPIRADDLARERAFVEALSGRTSYLRLLSPRHLSEDELVRFTDIDYPREMALVAIDGAQRQVAVARLVRLVRQAADEASDEAAAFAIVLSDAWQQRGLGIELMRSLITVARQMGIKRLTDFTLSENMSMLALARRLGFRLHREPGDATVTHMTLELAGWTEREGAHQGDRRPAVAPASTGITMPVTQPAASLHR